MGCAGSKAAEEPAGSGGSKPVETTEIKVEADPERKKSIQAGKRRVGVSAEATKEEDDKDYKPTVIPKSDEARERIGAATDKNALFAGLNTEQRTAVIDAMFEIQCTAAQDVILMGDVGDNFYVVESGARAGRPKKWAGRLGRQWPRRRRQKALAEG